MTILEGELGELRDELRELTEENKRLRLKYLDDKHKHPQEAMRIEKMDQSHETGEFLSLPCSIISSW